jgi:hypothetical protein
VDSNVYRTIEYLCSMLNFTDQSSILKMSLPSTRIYLLTISQPRGEAQDLLHWHQFVDKFYSPVGVLRHGVLQPQNGSKMFEITCAMLPRYYHTMFNSGIKRIQTHMEQTRERELASGSHVVESSKTSFMYWFSNDCQVCSIFSRPFFFSFSCRSPLNS